MAITVTLEEQCLLGMQPEQQTPLPSSKRNPINLDRGDGRQWTPPPSARELTAADPIASAPGPVGSSRKRGPWWTPKAARHAKRMRKGGTD